MSFPIIIIGGILAIPSLLIQAIVAPLVFIASLPALLVLIFRKKYNNNNNNNSRRCHVIITGGSSGIGLCVAQACVARKVDRITLLARNSETLKQAKEILLKQAASSETTKIDGISVDVTNPKAIQDAAKQVCQNDNSNSSTTTTTTTTYLFNCAGIAYPGYFEKMDSDIFTKTTNLNLLGTLYTTHAFLPYMMKSSGGTIVLVSSMGGQCGAFGYTAYAPTKIALKGFAEALHMELVNSDVNVQVVYPPDTDTPGYAEENKLKPKECFLISESVGFYKPDVVGNVMVKEAMKPNPRFAVYYGFDGYVLSTMTAGFGPETSLVDALSQISLAGLFRLVSFFYLNDFWRIIRKCGKESEEQKKSYGSVSMRQASTVTSSDE